ncbi:unnamed protein product [Rhizoctonia solani]|uniref:Uncharacterized protein n=1 Tax=Rhizoctonia solani TaxID=456999 RepID=A0A8H2XNE1_9AGAM|nr:unnamed protein product [Rhizoctonia solani]
MAIGAFGLPTQALVSLALLQCGTQGVLITLLANFLTSKLDHQAWFKIYVVLANVLTAGQTVVHVMQAFETIDMTPVRSTLVLTAPVLTGLIGGLVQPFFIYRCWKIYRQRLLAIIPLLLLWVVSSVSAFIIGAYISQSLTRSPGQPTLGAAVSTEVWSFSSLAFDMITTCSTVIYFFCVSKDLNARPGILLVVWQILWASAAPPLILIIISIFDGYIIPGKSGIAGVIAIGMMGNVGVNCSSNWQSLNLVVGKFYVLSLMINVVGQGYIRQEFERRWATPSPPRDTWFQKQGGQTHGSDTPVVHATSSVEGVEFVAGTNSIPRNFEREESLLGESGRELSDVSSLKFNGIRLGHAVHDIILSPKQEP